MIYLSGCLPSKPELRSLLHDAGVGVLTTYRSVRFPPDDSWVWAADNGCFSPSWNESAWQSWIKQVDPKALFAVVPDVVGQSLQTRLKWELYFPVVKSNGLRAAYVLQDGEKSRNIPWSELDAVFVGGSTEWKLSEESMMLIQEAKYKDKWVHMGRVNSLRRMMLARDWGCDSADGTYLAFGPDANVPKLVKWLQKLNQQPPLNV